MVTVRVGTYSGTIDAPTFPPSDVIELSSTTITIPPTQGFETISVPIFATIQPTELLYIGVHVPDQTFTGDSMFMASTASAETHSAYFAGSQCTGANVSSIKSFGYPYHLIIRVSGTH